MFSRGSLGAMRVARAARMMSTAARATAPRRATKMVAAAVGAAATGAAVVATTSSSSVECSWWNPLSWFYGVDYNAVRADIEDIIDDNMAGPVIVRLAWHCSGTYDKKTGTGGSNGATMRFAPESTDGANAGLDKARNLLEPLKAKYPCQFKERCKRGVCGERGT